MHALHECSQDQKSRNPRPETDTFYLQDRYETETLNPHDRDETEIQTLETETRPRRSKKTFRDRLETETFKTETTSLLSATAIEESIAEAI